MNISLTLTKARKELSAAHAKAGDDERTARIARQTAQAAKLKLKQARKLAKLAKKSARKADDQAEASMEALDRIQSKLEKLEKRAKKQGRSESEKTPRKAVSNKLSASSSKRGKSRDQKRSKPAQVAASAHKPSRGSVKRINPPLNVVLAEPAATEQEAQQPTTDIIDSIPLQNNPDQPEDGPTDRPAAI